MTHKVFITLAAFLSLAGPLAGQGSHSLAITTDELSSRLRLLSSDIMEGRYPGTRGESLTTAYLVSQLSNSAARPGVGDSWLQPLSIVVHDPNPDSPNRASISGRISRTLEHGRDIRFANNSATGEVAAGGQLVFVGYGIHAPIYRWDDFSGVDLRGKVAVALLGEPAVAGDTTRFNGVRASRFGWARDKIAAMGRRGAIGVLWVRPAGSLARSPVTGNRNLAAEAEQAGVRFTGLITDSALAALLPPRAPGLAELLASAGGPGFSALPLGVKLDAQFSTKPRTVTTHNVVGVVPGTDPRRAAEHVVLSAHWDAYGIGPAVNGDSIYNGALDDGSGVTVLLALARVFAANPQPRSITFLFTTAEEWGLLGAQGFVCSGPLSPERIVTNLNVDDGVELFGVKRDAAPLGIELSTLGRTVREVARRMNLRVSPDPFPAEGFFLRADNYPFARAGIPALYLALGTDAVDRPAGWADSVTRTYLERDYHRPSDDYETVVIDIRGSLQFAEFIRDLTIAVASAADRPQWLPGAEFSRPEPAAGSVCAAR